MRRTGCIGARMLPLACQRGCMRIPCRTGARVIDKERVKAWKRRRHYWALTFRVHIVDSPRHAERGPVLQPDPEAKDGKAAQEPRGACGARTLDKSCLRAADRT
jgi:hypothetical protein